jgi:RND family efflux transporter MFP subunit
MLSASGDGGFRPSPTKRSLAWLWYTLSSIAFLALLAWGGYAWFWIDGNSASVITATATIGDLPILVTERGELQSSKSVTVVCEVEGRQHKIIDILPEGTRVKKGEIVVRFDQEELKRLADGQEVKFKQAEGKSKVAKEKLEQAKYKAEGDIADAELAHTVADLELKKYVEAEYKVELDDKRGAIALAERELQEAIEKLEHYRKFVKSGFGTPEQLRVKEFEADQKRYYLQRDKAKLEMLEKYTRVRQETELAAKAVEAKRKLARVKQSSAAAIAEAQNELDAAQITERLEKDALDRIHKQLDKCIVKAPQDGIVVYPNIRYYDMGSRIAPGATVWFQQPIFTLPDLTKMQVKVKVHEAMIKKVKPGQRAEIRADALPGKVLHGEIKSVGTLADNAPWDERGVKEYATEVSIDDLPEDGGLKPGMTAEVRIIVNTLKDVLLVPVQGVTEKEGTHYAYVVKKGDAERREVQVGENNEKYVEIKSGVGEGEQVALDARSRIVAETGETKKNGEPKKNEEKPQEKVAASAPPAVPVK